MWCRSVGAKSQDRSVKVPCESGRVHGDVQGMPWERVHMSVLQIWKGVWQCIRSATWVKEKAQKCVRLQELWQVGQGGVVGIQHQLGRVCEGVAWVGDA